MYFDNVQKRNKIFAYLDHNSRSREYIFYFVISKMMDLAAWIDENCSIYIHKIYCISFLIIPVIDSHHSFWQTFIFDRPGKFQ